MPSDTEENRSSQNAVGDRNRPNVSNAPASPLFMPWFYSAPWLPKFNGERRRFGEWRTQVQAMLRAQPLSGEQQADFVFSALEGDARREVALLDEIQRNTGNKILRALKDLYGETVSTAQARSAFFKCRQSQNEKVGDFILRLRECHAKWRDYDEAAAAAGEDDEALLDQFVLGLKTGPVRTELQRLLRRQPRQGFKDLTKEARALEEELGQDDDSEEAVASAVRARPARTSHRRDETAGWSRRETEETAGRPRRETEETHARPQREREETGGRPRREVDEWKEELRQELKKELSEQVQALGTQLVEQLQGRLTPTNQPRESSRAPPLTSPSNPPAPANPSPASRFQWDSQGRPICLDCGEAGHVQRNCPLRRRPARGFHNPPPQRAGRWGW